MYSPNSPPIEIGGPCGSPRNPVNPDHACNVNSVAARSDHGPVQPKSEMVTTTHCGEMSSSRSGSMPRAIVGSRVPVTITTSARVISSSERVVTLRFPALR
jgi:hypothetical protein